MHNRWLCVWVGLLLGGDALAHGGDDHGNAAVQATPHSQPMAVDAPQRLADGQVRLAKATQLALQLRTDLTAVASARPALELTGTVMQNPDYPSQVAALQDGVFQPSLDLLPKAGTQVQAGQLLGYLQPVETVLDRSNQQAQAAAVIAELAVLDDSIQRLTPLADFNSRNQLEQAKLKRKGLAQQLALLRQSVQQAIAVTAPADGVVSAVLVRAGQQVKAGDGLFTLVQPTALWLDVSWFADDMPVQPLAFIRQTSQPLALVAMGQQREHQRLPLYFALPALAESTRLAPGSVLTVLVQHGEPLQGMRIARSALVRSADNQWLVWQQTAAETFRAIAVSFTALDHQFVLVPLAPAKAPSDASHQDHQHQDSAATLEPGMRIVVQGAALLNQVR